jgi:hypothetical protein
LEIAVHDAAVVRGGHTGAQLTRHLHGSILWHPSDATEQRCQVFPVDILHRQERASAGFSEIVETTHVAMRDLTRHAQFVVESLQAIGVLTDGLRQELQRDRLIEGQIVGAIDLAHPATAEQRHQSVPTSYDCARREAIAFRRHWHDGGIRDGREDIDGRVFRTSGH